MTSYRRASSASERWFHDRSSIETREKAEAVLREAGFAEGLFLVRESTTAEGDFVLSVVHGDEVIHYQIRRRGEDALFSLSEEIKVIHGLDEMLFFYRTHPCSGLQHELTDFVEGELCPAGVRLHGTENLLHRAAAAGDTVVVFELLQSGYRNLSAKNHDGQSAMHLASFFGHADVVQLLIRFGASVNMTDSSGYTPLHFACQANKPEVCKALLDPVKGKANPTIRNPITGWTPLHEAAWKGYTECVEVLLSAKAPIRSRTPNDETPADLARAGGFRAVAAAIDDTVPEKPASEQEDWLHGPISRQDAIDRLLMRAEEPVEGAFLVRQSAKKSSVLVLSLLHDMKTYHFEIIKQGVYYFLDQGPYMLSLEELVDHYSRFADGLPCVLRVPVSAAASAAVPSSSSPESSSSPARPSPRLRLPPRVPARPIPTVYPSNLRPIDLRNEYENNDTLRRARHSKDNVPFDSIRIGSIIGEGEFGSVFEGLYIPEKGEPRSIAIKVLNTLEPDQKDDFLREADVMMKLDHQCIVQMIGVCRQSTIMMLLELVPLGSLIEYLHEHPGAVQASMEIPLWAAQVACGMMYLESRRFVHRDLAARNILLASKFQAKISDFGLSRVIEEKQYYRATKGGRWPIKWYAPECVNFGTFSHQSDVWSFGVLLWEMFSYGKQPYEGMTGVDTVKFLENGGRLARPEKAELEAYSTMLWCWEYIPENRPHFKELFKIFSENPEYQNMKELLFQQDFQELGLL